MQSPVQFTLLWFVIASLLLVVSQFVVSQTTAPQQAPSATFTAAIPQDRTVCDQLGARLDPNEQLTEYARSLPASMRIRKGVIRQSPQSRMTTPMYVSFSVSNNSLFDLLVDREIARNGGNEDNISIGVIDARISADSLARTLGYLRSNGAGQATTNEQQAEYWERLIPTPPARDPRVVQQFKNSAEYAIYPSISTQQFLHALVQTGIGVFSETYNAGIPTLMSHLAMARIPVIKFIGCRSNATFYDFSPPGAKTTTTTTTTSAPGSSDANPENIIPWPLVYGSPYERFAFVVGVDLEFVYVVIPSLAEEAVAITRTEFLTRWHHTQEYEIVNDVTGDVTQVKRVIFHRVVASVFRPYNGTEIPDRFPNRFGGVLRQLGRPPEVVSFDGFC